MDIVKIIEILGGLSKASSVLKIPVSTLQYWQEKNKVPERQIDYVVKVAKKNGIFIITQDAEEK